MNTLSKRLGRSGSASRSQKKPKGPGGEMVSWSSALDQILTEAAAKHKDKDKHERWRLVAEAVSAGCGVSMSSKRCYKRYKELKGEK